MPAQINSAAGSVDMVAVAEAVAQTYLPRVAETRRGENSWTVILPWLPRIEEVLSDASLSDHERTRLQDLRKDSEVWVLVPLEYIGAAHGVLRGVVDRVQPWWYDGRAVQFGTARIP
jgi:hypothetical protein